MVVTVREMSGALSRIRSVLPVERRVFDIPLADRANCAGPES